MLEASYENKDKLWHLIFASSVNVENENMTFIIKLENADFL